MKKFFNPLLQSALVGLLLTGCVFQNQDNPLPQGFAQQQSTGLQITVKNSLHEIKTKNKDGSNVILAPHLNGKLCASAPTPQPQTAPTGPSHPTCIHLQGTIKNGDTQVFWLNPKDVTTLHGINNGKVHFMFRDSIQSTTLYFSCWEDGDLTLDSNTSSKQEIEVEVFDRGGNISYGCNVAKLK